MHGPVPITTMPLAEAQINFRYLWTIAFVAALGGLLFCYDRVDIGGAKPFYES